MLDLCAAPGSWCQVAAEAMPAHSLIVGVDLAPIKPIPRTTTFQSDITTDKCRATIRQHLKTWKADTVLHDGAPNVGIAWVQDAYSQAELVLQALRLATDFLVEGGTFVTKVFRSKDYNALLWVFNQLFNKVEATKPPSSRNVSAEIFVVCRGFKAPKRIDPKFLDPRSVFAELQAPTPNNEAKVFNPEKKKRKREGYEEGDYTQFKEAPVSEFIETTDPIAMLGSLNKLSFDQSKNGDLALATLDRLPETTAEIRLCCNDLKVLGRKEFKSLLRWRLKVREKFGFKKSKKAGEEEEEVAEVAPMDEELQIQEDLQRMKDQDDTRKKRDRRRENERKQKEIVRMQMNMTTPMEIGMEQEGPNGENAMFGLKAIDRAGVTDQVAKGRMGFIVPQRQDGEESSSEEESDEEEDRLDRELDNLYERYQEQKTDRDAKQRAKKSRKEHKDDEEWEGFSGKEESSEDEFVEDEDSNASSEEDDTPHGPLSTSVKMENSKDGALTRRAAMFFDQDIFQGIDGLDTANDEDSAIDMDSPEDDLYESSQAITAGNDLKAPKSILKKQTNVPTTSDPAAQIGTSAVKRKSKQRSPLPSDTSDDEKPSSFEVVKSNPSERDDPRTKSGALDINIITAEAMELARQLASGAKSSHDMIDEGFNKYSFADRDGLPEWFLDDESNHSKPHRPISAGAAAAIKEKLRALNARPIKKVREAKGRKKLKAAQRLEKLRKKSAMIEGDEGLNEADKAKTIARMMSRATKKKPKEKVKLVVARGGNRGISGRPRGVKGKYKIVDSRMKKDVRAEKRLAKKRK